MKKIIFAMIAVFAMSTFAFAEESKEGAVAPEHHEAKKHEGKKHKKGRHSEGKKEKAADEHKAPAEEHKAPAEGAK